MNRKMIVGMMVGAVISAVMTSEIGVGRADAVVGVAAGLLPGGNVTLKANGASDSAPMETGVALGARIGYDASSAIRVAGEVLFMPSLRGDNGNDDEPGLRIFSPGARLDAHRALSATAHLYAYGRFGYSRLTSADEDGVGSGVLIGGGLGGRFALSADLDGFVEAGYLWATHEVDVDGPNPRIDFDYFLLSAGVALNL